MFSRSVEIEEGGVEDAPRAHKVEHAPVAEEHREAPAVGVLLSVTLVRRGIRVREDQDLPAMRGIDRRWEGEVLDPVVHLARVRPPWADARRVEAHPGDVVREAAVRVVRMSLRETSVARAVVISRCNAPSTIRALLDREVGQETGPVRRVTLEIDRALEEFAAPNPRGPIREAVRVGIDPISANVPEGMRVLPQRDLTRGPAPAMVDRVVGTDRISASVLAEIHVPRQRGLTSEIVPEMDAPVETDQIPATVPVTDVRVMVVQEATVPEMDVRVMDGRGEAAPTLGIVPTLEIVRGMDVLAAIVLVMDAPETDPVQTGRDSGIVPEMEDLLNAL